MPRPAKGSPEAKEWAAKMKAAKAAKKGKKGDMGAIVAESHEPTTKAKKAPTNRTSKTAPYNDFSRAHAPIDPPSIDVKQIDQPMAMAAAAPQAKTKAPVRKRRGVQSDGLTAGAELKQQLQNEQQLDAAMSPDMPGQEERIKKELKRKPKAKIVTVGEGQEQTIDHMKTDDPKAISGDKPFSFQALRNRLLC